MYQYILTGAALGISSYTDLKCRRVYGAVAAAYLILAVLGHLTGRTASLTEMLAGVLPGVFCFLVSWVSRQSLGYGDSLVILICGVSLGFWLCIWITFTAFFWSGVWGAAVYRMRKMSPREEIPFIPFLLLGFVIQGIGGF